MHFRSKFCLLFKLRTTQQLQNLERKFLHYSFPQLVFKKENIGNNATTGICQGHPDNPIFHTNDIKYAGTKHDVVTPEYSDFNNNIFLFRYLYRTNSHHPKYIDRVCAYILGSFLWYWIVYHFYWYSGGHFYMPYLNEFTDEELGILPDDAEDPEYWGNHGKKWGTYR